MSKSGITEDDLQMLAAELRGDDFAIDHVMKSVGIELDPDAVYVDLVEAKLANTCRDCGFWDEWDQFEDGLCMDCYDEWFGDDDDFDDDEDDIFGFEDDDFDDEDDILDEDYNDYYFDETDEDDL